MSIDIIRFLTQLKKENIGVRLEDGNLRIKCVGKKVPPEIVNEIKSRKDEIVAFLTQMEMKPADDNRYATIDPVEKKEYYPLSSAQKRLYLMQQMDLNNTVYNMPFVLPLGKGIEPDRLNAILLTLIDRHEGLRTSFVVIDETPMQRIHDHVDFKTEYWEVSGEDDAHGSNHFIRPFDLSEAPLFRSLLIKTPDGNHIWMLDTHHTISDGTSFRILNEEFLALYNGGELEPLRIQYKDFSIWQNRLFETGAIAKQEHYWLDVYRGEIPKLNVPGDFPRPGVFDFRGDNVNFKLEGETAEKFIGLSRRYSGTVFMNFLTALNVIFYKYTGQTDIIIGSGIAGRPNADLQKIIGMFINTLAMRNYPEGHKSYDAFLQEVIQTTIAAFENQDMPLETLVEKLNLDRDPSRSPLFDVLVTVQNFGWENQRTGDREKNSEAVTAYEPKHTTAKFDMSFSILEQVRNIGISLEYYTSIYKRETITRFVRHLIRVIEQAVANPSVKLDDICIITEEEKKVILEDFNDTFSEYPREQTIGELFHEQVEIGPDRMAVEEPERRLQVTWRELKERSDRLTERLRQGGILPGMLVAIRIERSVEMMMALLGVLNAGGAYLPIGTDYPQERIDYMINDSGATLLVSTSNEEGEKMRSWEDQKVFLIEPLTLLTSYPLNFSPSVSSVCSVRNHSSLAYVIYTSGSTGRPKGVMVEHRGVVRLVKNCRYIEFTAHDCLLPTGAPAFDISTFETWGPLLNGARLTLVSKEIILNIHKLKDILFTHEVTILHLIPQLFNQIAAQDMTLFGRLRYFLIGGDQVRPAYINKLRHAHPGLIILHMYGPTENTTFSTFFSVQRIHELSIPIGGPIANATAYIMDKKGKPQPVLVPGELWVGGDGVARGYLNNPELTSEKFPSVFPVTSVPPVSSVRKKQIYKTGDLARWLSDGNIEFLGRIDHQVKIRGFRVELGEIENRLLSIPEIKEAVIAVKKDDKGDNYLCTYFISERKWETHELKDYLSNGLPEFMVPSFFVQLDAFPLSPNGKIDAKALPEPDKTLSHRQYVAPRNPIEEKLTEIWSEFLKVPRSAIGIDDSFFELGGHSLKAAQLVSRIQNEWHRSITLPDIFKSPTIRQLGSLLHSQASPMVIDTIPLVEEKEYYPLSFNQQRIWTFQCQHPESTSFCIPERILLRHELRVDAIRHAFAVLSERHEGFRTGFRCIDGQPVQFIVPAVEIPVEVIDISSLSEEEKEPEALKVFDAIALTTFDLSRPPLTRVVLIRKDAENWELIWDIHHIVTDGYSQELLKKEIETLYTDWSQGKPTDFEPLPLRYRDFAVWQRHRVEQAGSQENAVRFWHQKLTEGFPDLQLPLDGQYPSNDQRCLLLHGFIPEEMKKGLERIIETHHYTLFMVLLSAFNRSLNRLSGQKEIVLRIANAGRELPEVQSVMGYFVHPALVKHTVEAGETFAELLHRTAEHTLETFQYQWYPYEQVAEELHIKAPNIFVSFNMMNMGDHDADIDPAQMETKITEEHAIFTKYPINFRMIPYRNCIVIIYEAQRALFKGETLKRMFETFRSVLTEVIRESKF
ncbi:MAG: amino acid adenylation domain-containing protein [Candidatus Omnitrophota bacterium]